MSNIKNSINGQVAKASSTVKEGDTLSIRFGQKIVTVRVENLKETTKKEEAANMYTLLKEEKIEEPNV